MEDVVATFIALTGATTEEAVHYLEMSEGCAETAANLYWDTKGSEPGPRSSNTRSSGGARDFEDFEDEVRAPIEARHDTLIDNAAPFRIRQSSPNPDSRQHVTLSGGDLLFQTLFGAASFAVPGGFQSAISSAKQSEKWLLVNIQDPNLFASHALNRDVWHDETVKEIVSSAFVFWQRDRDSAEGAQFCGLYKIIQFPVIAAIDPRTGRMLKQWGIGKFQDAFMAMETLSEFLDGNEWKRVKRELNSAMEGSRSNEREVHSPKGPLNIPAEDPGSISTASPASRPDLPPLNTPGTVRIGFRTTSGQRDQISIFPDSPIATLLQYAAFKEGVPLGSVDVKPIAGAGASMPSDVTVTVGEAGLGGAMLVISKRD